MAKSLSKRRPSESALDLINQMKVPALLILFVLGLSVFLSSCASKDQAPATEQLMKKTKAAMAKQVGVNLSIKGTAQGDSKLNMLSRSLDKPLAVNLSGAVGKQAAQMNGKIYFGEESWPLSIRSDQTSTIVQLGNYWLPGGFGRSDLGERISPFKGTLRLIADNPDQVLSGEIEDQDGYWLFKGGLNKNALIQIEQQIDGITPTERKNIENLSNGLAITSKIDKQTNLPSDFSMEYQGDGAAAQSMLGVASLLDYGQEAKINLDIKFVRWGVAPKLGPKRTITGSGFFQSLDSLVSNGNRAPMSSDVAPSGGN